MSCPSCGGQRVSSCSHLVKHRWFQRWPRSSRGNTVMVMSSVHKPRHGSNSRLRLAGLVKPGALRCSAPSLTWANAQQPPNPSIERTVSSGLRPLPTAAHVKR